jgi:hypothetical protein|tara:strand:+ start:2620 stop:3978 length:1359 start_codon:yes stop_codon:yes gene_type:complete
MANQITSKSAEPSHINQLDIISNKNQGDTVSVVGGITGLLYYESILQDSVRATVTFADTGNAINDKTALEGLPIVGQEKVGVEFHDNNENKLKMTLYVNKVTPMSNDTTKSMVQLDLTSKEFIMNEKVRLNERFDGKISEHIKKILTDPNYLGTEKKVDVEETSNNYNFIGNNRKPYYVMNWLSKKSVSAKNQKQGDSAGYFFYETYNGFFFKSIDGLLAQEKKKSIIFNQSPDGRGQKTPKGYDLKALDFKKDNAVNVQNKLQMGAFSTRTVLFDPFSCYYEVITPTAEQKKSSYKTAGKDLPVLNKEFEREGRNKEFSRTTYMLLDKGSLPTGSGTGKDQEQLKKATEENFQPKDILNQSIMRYGQLFAQKSTITIPGDFSLHAGDVIFLDSPELKPDVKTDEVSKDSGGLYIIADLCHFISPKETYTKLNLVRDSFGRKGNHSSGSIPL